MKKALAAALVSLAALAAAPAQADGLPDYRAVSLVGPQYVVQGQTFTRTLTIDNAGTSGGDWAVAGYIRNVPHAAYLGVSDVQGFTGGCSLSKFLSGAFNYVVCRGAFLHPGESASFTLTFRAPGSGWLGWVYYGNGEARKTSMELDSNRANDSVGSNTTTVIA